MGSPKALLEVDGETFAGRLARIFATVASPVILVTGAHRGLCIHDAQEVWNPGWSGGQLSSLQAGIRAVPETAPAFFFAPVDCPAFHETTVRALWMAFQRGNAVFAIPRMNDKRGHPVLAARSMAAEFLALPAGGQAREVVHRYRSQTCYVDVDDPGIFADVDTREAYEALKARAR